MAVRSVRKNIKGSPKKYRRIINLIRGRRLVDATEDLSLMASPMAGQVAKAVRSAQANAENNDMLVASRLRISAAFADSAPSLKRFKPQARGRVFPIIKRRTHITIVLEEDQ
jgi:large subunit ribosomal protein L22